MAVALSGVSPQCNEVEPKRRLKKPQNGDNFSSRGHNQTKPDQG